MPFATTSNKDAIRNSCDRQIISQERQRKGKLLTYFGLPGWRMLDVLKWSNDLGRVIAVERDDKIKRQLLLDTAFRNDMDSKLQLLVGDIDDVILEGKDIHGIQPIEPTFDVVNLDYEGGILIKDLSGNSKRVSAIKELFKKQLIGQRDFILLITVNSRNRDEDEFNATLNQINGELAKYGVSASDVIDWYKNAGYDFKIKVYVPYVVDSIAVSNRFKCEYMPPITYLGYKDVRMIHFILKFLYAEKFVGKAESQSLIELINLPMMEAKQGIVSKSSTQAPIIALPSVV